MSNFHLFPIQDSGGNINYNPSTSNNSDKSLISIYWNDILNKPNFSSISYNGSYNNLNNSPWIYSYPFSYYSSTNSYVGIGTSNPLFKLDVNGSINLTGSLNKNGSPYQNSQWVTDNSNIYFNNGIISIGSSTIYNNTNLNGNIKISGKIIPSISSNCDLGSSDYRWRHLYLSSNSIYLDNVSISKTIDNYININSISINDIYLNSNGYDNNYIKLNENGLVTFNNKYPVLFQNSFDNSNIVLSNVFLSSSNKIYSNIISLNTNTITQGNNNRFIINDIYNRNINFTNNLTSSNIICSNLNIIGNTTFLNTKVYQTEQLEVHNDTTATSLIVKHYNINYNVAEFYNNLKVPYFIISSNNNIGIGISNPLYNLDIKGSLNTSQELLIKETNISNIIDIKILNSSNSLINYNNFINKPSLSSVASSGNYNDLILNPFIISGNNIYSSPSKNIGIGKTNPSFTLDINGSLNTSSEILIKETNISNIIDNKILNISNSLINFNNLINKPSLNSVALSGSYYDISNRPNQFGEYSNYNNLSNIIWNSNNNIYLNFNSNIGIGINNPSFKLDVNGIINSRLDVFIKNTNISNIIDNKILILSNSLINYNNLINKPLLSSFAFNGYYSNLIGKPILNSISSNNYYSNLSGSPFIITGNNSYSTFIGNLGVGIIDPLYKLDVNGSLNTSQEILIKGTNISNIIDIKNNTNSNLIKSKITSLNTDTIIQGTNNRFIINDIYNRNISFNQNLTTSNLIASNINVIGDTTVFNTTVYISKKVEVDNNTNATSIKISQINSTKNLLECFNSSQLSFIINSNANIGINNGNPSYKLDVNGNINTSQELFIKTTNISNIIDNKIIITSNTLINYNNHTNKPSLSTVASSGNYNDLSLKPFIISGNNIYNSSSYNGNIGIGISNSLFKFDINGTLNTSSELLIKGTNISNIIDSKIITSSNILINYNNLINKPILKTVANTGSYNDLTGKPIYISDYKQMNNVPFTINSTNNNLIYNSNNGNFGIGNTNPNYKVVVNGNLNYNGNLRFYNVPIPFSNYSNTNITASNGTFNYITNNNSFGYYTFLTSGSITFPQATNCDLLVVGAGGNGGMTTSSGGGGAGEVIYYPNYPFSAGTSNIKIGYSDFNINNRITNINSFITARGGGNGGELNKIAVSGGSGGGGYINQSGATTGTKWNATYSYSTSGNNGTTTIGGNGGSAINGGFTESITGTSLIVGVGGSGATATSIPSFKNTYGSGGDGNGGLGTQGIVIIKVPLNISKASFDGYINYSNIVNTPPLNNLLTSKNFIDIGYYNQVNFPLADTSWANEWFLYMGNSPTNVSNSFIFWHLNNTSNINSKWWFNGTTANTNNEISDIRIKKDIIDIINPLENLMLLKPKEYYLCDEKDYLKKYGIIAQDVKETMPQFVYTDEDYIANIFSSAIYNDDNGIYKLISKKEIFNNNIEIGDELKILLDNSYNQEIIIEDLPYHNRYKKRFAIVKRIIDTKTIEITKPLELTEIEKTRIFIYGKKVKDFLKLDYSSLYCLNIKCNQELYKIYLEQQQKLKYLNQRLLNLENYS